jgi:error-prone DNA polymerase
MPDPPPSKRTRRARTVPPGAFTGSRSGGGYVELHCRTNYSFLEGASHPDELVARAVELGYSAIAITDRNTLGGVVRAHVAAKDAGLKLLIGAEITPADAPPVVLLATDRAAYGRLCRLITNGKRRAPKGECHLTFDDVAEAAAGLLACVRLSPIHSPLHLNHQPSTINPTGETHTSNFASLVRYRDVFADRGYALAELHRGPDDRAVLRSMQALAAQADMPLVAGNDVHYHVPQRRFLQDALTAIRHNGSVAELGDRVFPNGERYLKSFAEMSELFADCPDAVARTLEVADRCTFSLDELRYEYPEELCPPGVTPLEHLTRLTWQGAWERYPGGVPDKVRTLVEHELQLIEELHYEAYFLTVWDLVRFARSRDILCQGRGSAANSAVCYCLGVTSVDPEQIDVLFERFVSKERNEAPDIDVDFEHERREEVLQYVYQKYGRERAALTAEVITYRTRSAVRDVGKALGVSPDRVEVVAKAVGHDAGDDKLAARFREAGFDPTSRLGRQWIILIQQILGFPRHRSQHVGGMVTTHGPLCELVPIENAAMPDRTVVEWDKDDLDALGILKVDCLALGMLTAIRKCFALLERHYGRPMTLATIPAEDPAIYEMISRADTMGVFQIESRAQMSMLPRLKPRCFYDLVIEVAIVRPGPIQGDMVHPYLRRRTGIEPVSYPNDVVRAVLHKTLGVPIFQEQAMRLAVVAAGFTPGEADQLRRAMAAWRRPGVIDAFQKKLIDGMQAGGYSLEFADRLFQQIRGFGEYGFPESHAASFALLVYVSAWLKRYYPAAFTAALLNSQPMGFYAPAQLVGDAKKHGVEVRPVDVGGSEWDCTLERGRRLGVGGRGKSDCELEPVGEAASDSGAFEEGLQAGEYALRLGFRMIMGLSERWVERIVACRRVRPFASFDDFVRRTGLSKAVLQRLAEADAFGSLGVNRRSAVWRSLRDQEPLRLFDQLPDDEPAAALPAMSEFDEVAADYNAAGLSLRGHLFQFLRHRLEERRIVAAAELADLPADRRYKVAGLVLLRQRPGTAKGITFMTIEDETGPANLIVRQDIWDRYHQVAASAQAIIAHGQLQRSEGVIHLLVDRLEDLTAELADVRSRSRDFH